VDGIRTDIKNSEAHGTTIPGDAEPAMPNRPCRTAS
jgi:hypothetical protein